MAKQQRIREQKQVGSKGSEKLTEEGAVPAIVEGVLGHTGTHGEVTQVKCRVLQGKNRGKSMRRNVLGPVKKRDILMLRETEIEARKLTRNIKRGAR